MAHLPATIRYLQVGNLLAKSKVIDVKELTRSFCGAFDGGLPPPWSKETSRRCLPVRGQGRGEGLV
jgi:hypothetical protein